MASSRKPSYRPAGRRPGAGSGAGLRSGGGAGPSNGAGPGTGAGPGASPPGVISAERQLDGSNGSEAATILAFPESRARKLRRRIMWVAGITSVLVAALIVGAIYSPVLAVREITVDGTKLLTPGQVREALKPLEGRPLPQVGEDEVTALLGPLVQVRSVRIEAHPPSEVVVHVRERVPVALMKQGEKYVLVDVEGVELGATSDPTSVALPLIDGGGKAPAKDVFSAITAVLATLPPDILARMSTASAESVDSVKLKLDDGKTILWGNAEEMELKARVLEALLRAPANPKVPVSVYDVSTPRHAFTK